MGGFARNKTRKMDMNKQEIFDRDYKWILRVVESCQNMQHVDGAMNCYDLWIKKHNKVIDAERLTASRDIYRRILSKINKFT